MPASEQAVALARAEVSREPFGSIGPDAPFARGVSLGAALKRRTLIFSIALLATSAVATWTFLAQPVYRATARVEVEPPSSSIQSISDLAGVGMEDEETFLSTQVEILQSDTVAWRAIEQVALWNTPEFKDTASGHSSPNTDLIEEFGRRLTVDRERDTGMVGVSFDSADPRLAATVANAVIDNYIEYNFRLKYDSMRQATAWMEQQSKDLKQKVEASQKALVDYEVKNSIVSIGDKESAAELTLANLSRDLTDAQADRARKESLKALVDADPSKISTVAPSDLLETLQENEADLATQLADATQSYGPAFPKVVRYKAQVDEAKAHIEREMARMAQQIQSDYTAAKAREDLCAQAVAQQKEEVKRFNQLSVEHNLLKREFDSNQTLYDNLMQHMKDATISAGLRATNVHIIDRAITPSLPSRPKKARNIALGAIGGLFLGFLAALLRENLDYSVKGAEEVEAVTGCPTLSIVPDVKNGKIAKGDGIRSSSRSHVSTVMLDDPLSPVAESIRSLRTAILLSRPGHAPETILVTSANPSEGKTTTAINLSIALAQRGERVLLIDGDFRRPNVATHLGIPLEPGLSNVLTGQLPAADSVVELAELPALSVLPAGTRPPNPTELLSSPGMQTLLQELRRHYTSVVIDSPPVLMFTDPIIIATISDAVIVVAANESTTRSALVRTINNIRISDATIGVVLNKVNLRRTNYYGRYTSSRYRDYSSNGNTNGKSKRNV